MSLKFCPACGGPLQWQSVEEERHQQPVCTMCGYVLWQNPKPTVSALLVRSDGVEGTYEVLLVRRARPPREGFWDCPGGFIDPDEHPKAAVQRELQEELGVEASDPKFLGIYMDRYGQDGESTLNIYYWGAIRRGRPAPRSDVNEAKWFSLGRLPKLLAFENNRQALEALRRLLTTA
jgi:ADP-ribose pyrophosphatase YjhB (NUDIX family)